MTSIMTTGRTYVYEDETFASLKALANTLYYDYAFTGDISDFEYFMYCIDGITEDEAKEICDRIRDLYTEEYGYEDDIELAFEDEI